MDLTEIQGVQEIFQRIREIESLPNKLESETSKLFAKNPINKTEFSKELESQISKSEEIPQPVKKVLSVGQNLSQVKPVKSSVDSIIQKEAKAKGLDPDLVRAIIKAESNFNSKAVSPVGAKGLMQLMPETAEMLGVENPFNSSQNIKGGTKYLKDLMKTFKDKDLALAAYNAGPGAVKKYKGIPPYSETKEYVKKVNEFYEDLKD